MSIKQTWVFGYLNFNRFLFNRGSLASLDWLFIFLGLLEDRILEQINDDFFRMFVTKEP